jgi:cell wall-associated NlpC family hydrolase
LKQGLHAIGIGVTILAMVSSAKIANAAQVHKVRQGDTLWAISKHYGVSIYSIKCVNNVSSNKPLKLGLNLKIPADNQASQKPKAKVAKRALSNKAVTRFGAREARRLAKLSKAADSDYAQHPEVVQTALAYRGSRYVRGGTGRRGFDCSGFTRFVYSKYGVSLPHQSGAQSRCGIPVSRSELKPGDLLFFHTRRRAISHVGIYIGNNRFVHASTPGRGVMVSSLGEAYYATRYRCARRIQQ